MAVLINVTMIIPMAVLTSLFRPQGREAAPRATEMPPAGPHNVRNDPGRCPHTSLTHALS